MGVVGGVACEAVGAGGQGERGGEEDGVPDSDWRRGEERRRDAPPTRGVSHGAYADETMSLARVGGTGRAMVCGLILGVYTDAGWL